MAYGFNDDKSKFDMDSLINATSIKNITNSIGVDTDVWDNLNVYQYGNMVSLTGTIKSGVSSTNSILRNLPRSVDRAIATLYNNSNGKPMDCACWIDTSNPTQMDLYGNVTARASISLVYMSK